MDPRATAEDPAADLRGAADELVAELRALLTALGRTTAPAAVVDDVALAVAELTRALQSHVPGDPGGRTAPSHLGLFGVAGPSSPLVPELTFHRTTTGGLDRTVLSQTHAGHPHIAHGGITAVLLDDVMGRAAFLPDVSSVTSGLSIRYRKPVPIRRSLLITATLGDRSGPWLAVTGTVACADDPDTILVEAHGTWYFLDPDRAGAVLGAP